MWPHPEKSEDNSSHFHSAIESSSHCAFMLAIYYLFLYCCDVSVHPHLVWIKKVNYQFYVEIFFYCLVTKKILQLVLLVKRSRRGKRRRRRPHNLAHYALSESDTVAECYASTLVCYCNNSSNYVESKKNISHAVRDFLWKLSLLLHWLRDLNFMIKRWRGTKWRVRKYKIKGWKIGINSSEKKISSKK